MKPFIGNGFGVRAFVRRLAGFAFLGVALMAATNATAAPRAAPTVHVGFEEVRIPNGTEPPLVVGVWYPTRAPARSRPLETFTQTVAPGAPVAGHRLPLVVLSHGGGGSYAGHYDTALALARAGFVAAAVSHAGDTYDDQSQVLKLWRRPAQLSQLVSYMLDSWPGSAHIDPRRVGAFGFSNGGFTALVAAGGRPDLEKIRPYCRANPGHDLCTALDGIGGLPALEIPPDAWTPDPRIRAIVIAAPGFGFTFDRAGLENVRVPVQLWRGADDQHQPDPWYDEAVRTALPRPPEYHVVPDAGHYAFLAPCSAQLATLAPSICTDAPGFDRSAFHRELNAQIVRFFRASMPARRATKAR